METAEEVLIGKPCTVLDSIRDATGGRPLFICTIRGNIASRKPDASDIEVINAAKQAHAHRFIERFPDGYDNVLGERGCCLNQGYRQLIVSHGQHYPTHGVRPWVKRDRV